MPTPRLAIPLALLCLTAWPGGLRPSDAGEGAAPPAEAVTIPFAHAVGERWRLRFECEERHGEAPAPVVTHEAQVAVLSPLGRRLLVELRWTHETRDGETTALWPRREATVARLDAKGGGRLLLGVDTRGTALEVINHQEARAALERARGAALDPAAWADAAAGLLHEWNVTYGACGVPMVPSAARETPLADAGGAAGADERVLLPEGPEPARPLAWSVRSSTSVVGAPPRDEAVHLTSNTRFDVASRRLTGWQLSVRSEAQRRTVRRIAFSELPAAEDVSAAAVAAR